jgi:FkbM family methyltransferase
MASLTIALGRITRPLTDKLIYTARCGVAKGLRRRGGLGWLPRGESDEERFVRELDVAGKVVYDVGSFEGLFTCRFAQSARQVVTFEPHPWCLQRTAANVALNGLDNVRIVPVALSDDAGLATLSYPENEPARSTIMDGQLATLTDYKLLTTPVLCWTLDYAVETLRLPVPDLIKIDAEGAEVGILRGARGTILRYRPQLYIEVHGTGGSVVALLKEFGYVVEAVDETHCLAHVPITARSLT